MNLGEKIVKLRRRRGWSQEELADRMGVSRQAVSKWEAGQATPDIERIIMLSELFGVSTDHLLKDGMESEHGEEYPESARLRITRAAAGELLDMRRSASVWIAVAVALCIIAVIPLLVLLSVSEYTPMLGEGVAVCIGIVILLAAVAVAVGIFIRVGIKSGQFNRLDTEPFVLEHGVADWLRCQREEYRPTYVRYNVIGACTCIMSPVPLICAAFWGDAVTVLLTLCLLLAAVSVGVGFFVLTGVRWAAIDRLLSEGDYSKRGRLRDTVSGIYWLAVTALYLGWSFLSGDWHMTWVVWPVAGVLSAILELICNSIT